MLWLIAAVGLLAIWWLPTLAGYMRLPPAGASWAPRPVVVVLTAVLLR